MNNKWFLNMHLSPVGFIKSFVHLTVTGEVLGAVQSAVWKQHIIHSIQMITKMHYSVGFLFCHLREKISCATAILLELSFSLMSYREIDPGEVNV